jgi:signal transduction histidine kinase
MTSRGTKREELGGRQPSDRLRRISQQIERAQRYVTNAAHELLTPLTMMHGEVSWALQRPRDAASDQATFEEFLSHTNDLIGLTRDLLTLASAGAPDARPAASDVSALTLVRRAVESAKLATGAPQRIELDVDEALLQGREEDLVRMLRNLLDNALLHGPEDGVVRVCARTERPEEALLFVITVEDSGPTLGADLRERIFEPFFRSPSSRRHPGCGLGLAIAREIAQGHGGSLVLDQAANNMRFIVRLPVEQPLPASDAIEH